VFDSGDYASHYTRANEYKACICIIACRGRHRLWPSWTSFVVVMVCGRRGFGRHSPPCGRHGFLLGLSWFVAVMV